MHKSQYMTNSKQLIDCYWLQSSSKHVDDLKALDYKTLRCINIVAFVGAFFVYGVLGWAAACGDGPEYF